MGRLNEEQISNIQKIIKEEYDLVEKPKKLNEYDIQHSVQDIYEDNAMQEILKVYDKKRGTDLQAELRAYLEPTTMEKVRTSIEGENINKIKKQEQQEYEKEISSLSKDGLGMDEETKREVKKDLEEKREKEPQELTEENLRAIVLKAMYKTNMEKYYNYKLNLQEGRKGQLERGDISVNEKQGTELLLYERYLKRLDERYMGLTGKSVIREDKEIKEFEEKLAIRSAKNEEYILKENDKDIEEVRRVYEERNDIATDIAVLSSKAQNMSPEKFKEEMDALQKDYLEVSAKLHNLRPNPFELQQSIDARNKEEEGRERETGYYDIKHERELGGRVRKEEMENEDGFEENLEDLNDASKINDDVQDRSAETLLEQYYEAEERGNYAKAEELLQSLEMMAGIQYEDKKVTNGEEKEDRAPQEIEGVEEEKEQRRGGIFDDPRMSATNNDEEVAKIEAEKKDRSARIKDVKEKLSIERNRNKTVEKDEYVPTLNNRKGY